MSVWSSVWSEAAVVYVPVTMVTVTERLAAAPESSTRSEERRVGKECRSRCDWSSDVCSSDLDVGLELGLERGRCGVCAGNDGDRDREARGCSGVEHEIGRASCRERV